jgi:hypothetical protein
MMAHCRFKNPDAWEVYKRHMREGRTVTPLGRNFYAFTQQSLVNKGRHVPFTQGPARASTFLDTLSS